MAARKHPPLLQRMWAMIEPDPVTGCWEWVGGKTLGGYGRISIEGVTRTAHRVLFEQMSGPISGLMEVDHLCVNRGCVNPAHLESVSREENIQRSTTNNTTGKTLPTITIETVRAIEKSHKTCAVLAREHGISSSSVERIRADQHWSQTNGKAFTQMHEPKVRRRDRLVKGEEWTEYQVIGSWNRVISRHDTEEQAKIAMENLNTP